MGSPNFERPSSIARSELQSRSGNSQIMGSLDRPSLDEIDAFYRNPSSLSPDRLALLADFVVRERVNGSSRTQYLRRRQEIEAAVARNPDQST